VAYWWPIRLRLGCWSLENEPMSGIAHGHSIISM
jgi:hypothetical protein